MSDLRKAAEMALEALSEYTGVVTSGTDPTKWDEVVDGGGPAREAIQALRQALAQPEQESFIVDRGCWERGCMAYDCRDADAVTIEAKLKEKNT